MSSDKSTALLQSQTLLPLHKAVFPLVLEKSCFHLHQGMVRNVVQIPLSVWCVWTIWQIQTHSTETQICPRDGLERSNPASGVKEICVCHRSHCCYGWATAQKLNNLNHQISSLLSEVQFHVRKSENPPPKTGATFINMDCKLMTSFTWTNQDILC